MISIRTQNSNIKKPKRTEWIISPSESVEYPPMNSSSGQILISDGEIENIGFVGLFTLVDLWSRNKIDPLTFKTSLEYGIREYEHIWKSLSKK
jgi:hypothetical protein